MSQDQLNSLRENLIESIIQVIVSALTGGLLPGNAVAQLESWVAGIFQPLINLIGPALGAGTGLNLPDFANLFSGIPDVAAVTTVNTDILNFRNNQPIGAGFESTVQSNLNLLHLSI